MDIVPINKMRLAAGSQRNSTLTHQSVTIREEKISYYAAFGPLFDCSSKTTKAIK